ncbi:MAG TPA: hypothetical protein VKH19_20025 [Gemmatimonadaceae bacterium]|nr:hypothetical protein [Gemmatimonadaceae bacterium]
MIAMSLKTFAERVRLRGTDRFVLWQSAFDFDVADRVFRDSAGRIPAFPTAEAARAYGIASGLAVEVHPAGVDPVNDLDAVTTWATKPRAETIDRQAIVHGWMFLHHADVISGMYEDELDPALEHVVSQLDRVDMAASDPQRFDPPVWTAEELQLLARTLRRAVDDFAALLAPALNGRGDR